jgi:hypothetical protein
MSEVEVSDLYFKVRKIYIRLAPGASPRSVFELAEQVYAVLARYDSSYEAFYGWEVNPQLNPLALEPEFLKQLLRCLSDVRREGSAQIRQDVSMIVGITETCSDGTGVEKGVTVIPVLDDTVTVPISPPLQSVQARTHVRIRSRRGRGARRSAPGKFIPVELAHPKIDAPGILIPVELDLPVSVTSRPRKPRRRKQGRQRPPKGRRGGGRVRRSVTGTCVVTGTSRTPRRPRVSGRTKVANSLPNPRPIDSTRSYPPVSHIGKSDVTDFATMGKRHVTHPARKRDGLSRGLSRREISFYAKIRC